MMMTIDMNILQILIFFHSVQLLLEWKGFRRLYIYAMTENMKYVFFVCHDDVDDELNLLSLNASHRKT